MAEIANRSNVLNLYVVSYMEPTPNVLGTELE